eukprot:4456355-Pleurochrysis_carterae.AAC.1
MQPAAEESAHRPDTSRFLSRMESVDAGSQCQIIALRSGGGRSHCHTGVSVSFVAQREDACELVVEPVVFTSPPLRHEVAVKVDHVLLASVDVRHAHVVDVIAEKIAGCACRRCVRG